MSLYHYCFGAKFSKYCVSYKCIQNLKFNIKYLSNVILRQIYLDNSLDKELY